MMHCIGRVLIRKSLLAVECFQLNLINWILPLCGIILPLLGESFEQFAAAQGFPKD